MKLFGGRSFRVGLVIPLAIFYVVFFLLPQLNFARLSLYEPGLYGDTQGSPTLNTLSSLLARDFFQHAVIQTVQLCMISSIVTLLLAYPLAYVIVRHRRIGSILFVTVAATMFSSAVARVLGWQVLLASNGPINDGLKWLGIISESLQLSANFAAVVIGTVHAIVPIAVIALMPTCQGVPLAQMQAARGMGASEWTVFHRIFFPQTLPGVISVGLLVFAITAGAFTTPVLLGGGRVGVLSILIYENATFQLNFPVAAGMSIVLLALVAVPVVLALALSRRSTHKTGVL